MSGIVGGGSGGAECSLEGVGDVDYERELVDEFVFLLFSSSWVGEAAEEIYHLPTYVGTDPDVAVDDPYNVAFGFSVCSTHVADLWVRTQICCNAIAT